MHMTALSSGRGLISFRINGLALNALTIALRYACTRKQFENYTKDD
jgi:alkylation response protein AidB-like acyl-CoA dehydrogenase